MIKYFSDEWRDRRDTINALLSQDTLTEAQLDEIEEWIRNGTAVADELQAEIDEVHDWVEEAEAQLQERRP
jgi:peptidoglycan hydrolase CwlO-like protein